MKKERKKERERDEIKREREEIKRERDEER